LDQYLIHHYFRAFIMVLASFYIVYFLADLRSLLDDISNHPDVTYTLLARYFGIAAPSMVLSGMPLAALFASLLSLGILERRNEVTAMKAAGISLYRISLPVLGAAVFFCAAHYLVADYVLPAANTRAAELRARIRNVEPASTFGPRQWVFGREGRLYNFAIYSQAEGEYQGLTIYHLSADRTRLVERIEAQGAHYEDGIWVLERGWARSFQGEQESFRRFEEQRLELPEGPDYFRRGVRPPQQMSFARLRRYIAGLRQAGYDVQELQVALHEKASTAAVPFVLVLLGLPYAFRAGRRGALAGAGLALGLAVVFYVFLAAFRQLGAVGLISPFLAAWSPDLLFSGVGILQMLSLKT
jgi:LPS export ABC transporter permease LptG